MQQLKKRKKSCFLNFEKKRKKNAKNVHHGPLNHSAFNTHVEIETGYVGGGNWCETSVECDWTGRVFSVESKWCGTSVKMWWIGVGSGVEMSVRVSGGEF